jgi:hypothetical protein
MSNNWNDDWRDELKTDSYDIWERLCDCVNTRNDVKIMAKLMYKYNKNHTKEECLDRINEWMCANSQPNIIIVDSDEVKKVYEFMGD